MIAWINEQNRKAIAEMAEMLEAESRAKAAAEIRRRAVSEGKSGIDRKLETRTERKLLMQQQRFNALLESIEAQRDQEITKANGRLEERLEILNDYKERLREKEQKLSEAEEHLKAETAAKMLAYEKLKLERQRVRRAEAKLREIRAAAKARARAGLTGRKERIRTETQRAMLISAFRAKHHYVFSAGNLIRKLALAAVIVIFSAITFALRISDNSPAVQLGPETAPAKVSKAEAPKREDFDTGRPSHERSTGLFYGGLGTPAPSRADVPASRGDNWGNAASGSIEEKNAAELEDQPATEKISPPPKIITSANSKIVRSSDNVRWKIRAGSSVSYQFAEVAIPDGAAVKSVVLFIEHFEEGGFAEGRLEWYVGTGWPDRPVVWASLQAPIYEGQTNESVDAWDVTGVVGTPEQIGRLQLQVKNGNNLSGSKTLLDYAYVVVEYD
jgi:hypothetical protein